MLIKVSEATPRQLDYMVAYIMGATEEWRSDAPFLWNGVPCVRDAGHDVRYSPSTSWWQGGPIIEREGFNRIVKNLSHGYTVSKKLAVLTEDAEVVRWVHGSGPTPLIAAMRCYVVAKWNHEVEIPEELTA